MPLFTLTFTFLEFISVCLTTAFTLLTVVDGQDGSRDKSRPHANEHDMKRATIQLKGLQTRKNKKRGMTAR